MFSDVQGNDEARIVLLEAQCREVKTMSERIVERCCRSLVALGVASTLPAVAATTGSVRAVGMTFVVSSDPQWRGAW